ncbi:hypothetical protein LP416_07015 [Polaromonas sp. P2-4]|nr:hypothetical protein LP416_07015 [Polaromonas sp. P2-4]
MGELTRVAFAGTRIDAALALPHQAPVAFLSTFLGSRHEFDRAALASNSYLNGLFWVFVLAGFAEATADCAWALPSISATTTIKASVGLITCFCISSSLFF